MTTKKKLRRKRRKTRTKRPADAPVAGDVAGEDAEAVVRLRKNAKSRTPRTMPTTPTMTSNSRKKTRKRKNDRVVGVSQRPGNHAHVGVLKAVAEKTTKTPHGVDDVDGTRKRQTTMTTRNAPDRRNAAVESDVRPRENLKTSPPGKMRSDTSRLSRLHQAVMTAVVGGAVADGAGPRVEAEADAEKKAAEMTADGATADGATMAVDDRAEADVRNWHLAPNGN